MSFKKIVDQMPWGLGDFTTTITIKLEIILVVVIVKTNQEM